MFLCNFFVSAFFPAGAKLDRIMSQQSTFTETPYWYGGCFKLICMFKFTGFKSYQFVVYFPFKLLTCTFHFRTAPEVIASEEIQDTCCDNRVSIIKKYHLIMYFYSFRIFSANCITFLSTLYCVWCSRYCRFHIVSLKLDLCSLI